MAADCISFLVSKSVLTPGTGTTETPTTFRLSPAGTLDPDNAFEITFKRLSDTCMEEGYNEGNCLVRESFSDDDSC
jgi:hypothetical protein